jgi:hypothetical protein
MLEASAGFEKRRPQGASYGREGGKGMMVIAARMQ